MVSLISLYSKVKVDLASCGIDNFRQEAALIIENITGYKKYELSVKGEKSVSDEQVKQVNQLVLRRKNGEPLQYILGEWEFYGLNFKVGEGVLIPRQDTETLIDVVIENLKEIENPVVADLCSGSGCIAIALKKMLEFSKVYAIELSDDALPYLKENAKENNVEVEIISGDILNTDTLNKIPMLDCIVSNPPYLTDEDMTKLQKEVAFEPELALWAGCDGLYFYREIIKLWSNKLKKSGLFAFECGIDQHNDIKEFLEQNGFENICFKKDLCGIIRVVTGKKK